MATFQTCIDKVRIVLQEEAPGDYWEDPELLIWGQETIDEIARLSQHKRKPLAFDVVAGQATYEWVGDLSITDLIELLTGTVMLDGVHLEYAVVADMTDNWQEDTGTPTHYLLNLNGTAGITLWPTPTAASVGLAAGEGYTFDDDLGIVLDIEGLDETDFDSEFGALLDASVTVGGITGTYKASKGATLASAAGTPDIPSGCDLALRCGVLSRAYEKNGAVQSPKESLRYKALFHVEMDQLAEQVGHDNQGSEDRSPVSHAY